MPIEIRTAAITDVARIKVLMEQLGYSCKVDEIADALSLADDNTHNVVAVYDAGVIGFMSSVFFYYFPFQQQICRITAIVVDSHYRASGVGNALIDYLKQHAQSRGCQQLEVTTSLARKSTHTYYENRGFTLASYRYFMEL